jgi:LemA protein
MEILYILLGLVVIIGLWYITVSNGFKTMLVKIDEAESGIDVALTQRFDMLSKMFQATKGYLKHEKETLAEVVKLRQPNHQASIQDKEKFANEVTKGLQTLSVVVEQYPDLKGSDNVKELQKATFEIEENLQAARRLYNSNVSSYNQSIVVFPNSIIANLGKFLKKEFFEAESSKREDVKFDF